MDVRPRRVEKGISLDEGEIALHLPSDFDADNSDAHSFRSAAMASISAKSGIMAFRSSSPNMRASWFSKSADKRAVWVVLSNSKSLFAQVSFGAVKFLRAAGTVCFLTSGIGALHLQSPQGACPFDGSGTAAARAGALDFVGVETPLRATCAPLPPDTAIYEERMSLSFRKSFVEIS